MQSVDRRDKVTVLIMLAASTTLGVAAQDISQVAGPAAADGASSRLLFAAALAGSLIAVLMLLSFDKDHRSLVAAIRADWPQLAGLGALALGYAALLEPLGFFFATSLFLAIGYLLLGERRWQAPLLLSAPVAAALEFLIYGVFGVAVADPALKALGVIA
jgi:putative tricarboxylic transport membrane protein